ncbi:MAG: hypothetical protein AUI14_13860 [Actinobacteria bacterium 13_2_20CM_2_71_6]|nr:MAG: hypothetical protein AUI14_13860 [Actinobacteria bacterium 13_2_20CM_2_71_6]
MRAVAATPLAFGGLAFHPIDDPVDDRFALELGEHAEHLYQHPADGGGGVDWFGGRAEADLGGVELVEDVHEAAQRSGQAVDPVDEQDVVPAGFGGGQRPL